MVLELDLELELELDLLNHGSYMGSIILKGLPPRRKNCSWGFWLLALDSTLVSCEQAPYWELQTDLLLLLVKLITIFEISMQICCKQMIVIVVVHTHATVNPTRSSAISLFWCSFQSSELVVATANQIV